MENRVWNGDSEGEDGNEVGVNVEVEGKSSEDDDGTGNHFIERPEEVDEGNEEDK